MLIGQHTIIRIWFVGPGYNKLVVINMNTKLMVGGYLLQPQKHMNFRSLLLKFFVDFNYGKCLEGSFSILGIYIYIFFNW